MAGPAGRQLGFEFTREVAPSAATVELAGARARGGNHAGKSGSLPRVHQGGGGQATTSLASQPVLHPARTSSATAAPSRPELATALELQLRARFGAPLRLTITDNRRTMVSLRRPKNGELVEVRLHHMFLQAEPAIWTALCDYLFLGDQSHEPAPDRRAASQIAHYIERHRQAIRRPERRPLALSSAGNHHDLQAICHAINQRYFAGAVQVSISWSRENAARPRAGRRSIKLGSYTSRDRLIRVHPALDAAFVPRYFVEYIVYHEMLHHVLPPKLHNGRRELHGPKFQARERLFQHFDAALRWERENLDRLLSSRVQSR